LLGHHGVGSADRDLGKWHTYIEPGFYLITLVVTNDLGCVDTATVQLLVYQDPLVFVPDCFTPDGDGLNEAFQAVFNGPRLLRDMELLVFNRWGEELVTISDPQQSWDGTCNGEPAQDGIYPWRLRFRTMGDSRAREVRGHVSLLR
jgi:gliding motility-associated-like protein